MLIWLDLTNWNYFWSLLGGYIHVQPLRHLEWEVNIKLKKSSSTIWVSSSTIWGSFINFSRSLISFSIIILFSNENYGLWGARRETENWRIQRVQCGLLLLNVPRMLKSFSILFNPKLKILVEGGIEKLENFINKKGRYDLSSSDGHGIRFRYQMYPYL